MFQILDLYIFRYGLVVRIAGSHPAGPGSIPGNGNYFLYQLFKSFATVNKHKNINILQQHLKVNSTYWYEIQIQYLSPVQ